MRATENSMVRPTRDGMTTPNRTMAPPRSQDRERVADTPEDPDQRGALDAALAADDGAHRDHVVRIRRVADAEEEPDEGVAERPKNGLDTEVQQ